MIVSLFGWIGATLLCVAPFFIDTKPGKIAAILGLLLLTVQAIDAGFWNLCLLNTIGVIGYAFAYIRH